jgi:histidine triad (HIT) family protein
MDDVARSTKAIIGSFDPEGVAVWQNNGIPAHQTVPHLHVHGAGTLVGGGTQWGDVERLSMAATDQIAEKLAAHLPSPNNDLLAQLASENHG